jgi:hypothetical protein
MRITDVDPDLIPADDDRWESVRPSPWPLAAFAAAGAFGLLLVALLYGVASLVTR